MARLPHLLGASYIILSKGEKILLQKRFQTGWMDGYYSLPAGHTESGESLSETLVREVKEEIGVTVNKSSTKLIHISHRFASPTYQIVDAFFSCSIWEGEPIICEKDKADELLWCNWNELPENTVPYIKTAIELGKKGICFSEYGWDKNTPC